MTDPYHPCPACGGRGMIDALAHESQCLSPITYPTTASAYCESCPTLLVVVYPGPEGPAILLTGPTVDVGTPKIMAWEADAYRRATMIEADLVAGRPVALVAEAWGVALALAVSHD